MYTARASNTQYLPETHNSGNVVHDLVKHLDGQANQAISAMGRHSSRSLELLVLENWWWLGKSKWLRLTGMDLYAWGSVVTK